MNGQQAQGQPAPRASRLAWLFLALWIGWILFLAWMGRAEWDARRPGAGPRNAPAAEGTVKP